MSLPSLPLNQQEVESRSEGLFLDFIGKAYRRWPPQRPIVVTRVVILDPKPYAFQAAKVLGAIGKM
jgi:hypothetical protein